MKTINTYYYNKEYLSDFINEIDFRKQRENASSILLQVYSGIFDKEKLQKLVEILNEFLPEVVIIGATTGGEIMDGNMSYDKIVLSFIFFETTNLSVALIKNTEISCEKELVKTVYNNLIKSDTKGILMFSVPYVYHIDIVLNTFIHYCKSIPVFGGIAGRKNGTDNIINKHYVLTNAGVSDKAVAIVSMNGNSLNVATDYHLNWQPIGKKFSVTSAEGRILKEIDGTPAAYIYTKYLGERVTKNLPDSGTNFPFIFHKKGIPVARVVVGITDDNAIELTAKVEKGDVFQFSYGHIESIISKDKEIVKTIADIPVQTILVFSCISRLVFLQDSAQLELNHLKELVSSAGFFTYGEFYHGNSGDSDFDSKCYCNLLMNSTLTLVMLSEDKEKLSPSKIKNAKAKIFKKKPSKLSSILIALTKLITVVTQELNQSNKELNQTNEELTTLLTRLREHNETIEKMNKNTRSSIKYARRIQEAMLPTNDLLKQLFSNFFVLYKPLDIVSGDFYWTKKVCDKTYIAVADCTGHGVPGAFMSLLGMSFLDEIVTEQICNTTGKILDKLRNKIKTTLKQEGKSKEQKDGMDMALCMIDKNNLQMQYSGAYNPLYIIRENENIENIRNNFKDVKFRIMTQNNSVLIDVRADRQPVAIHPIEKPFTTRKIKIHKDDNFYLFSDGFVDQNGGKKDKKYLSRNFKKLLLNIHKKSMSEQYEILKQTIENWKNGRKQVDDILVVGINI